MKLGLPLSVAVIVAFCGLSSCAQTQSSSSPLAASNSVVELFESSASHPWSNTVQVHDDRLVFDQGTLMTASVGAFDSAAPRTAESEESWADHWAFGPNHYEVFSSETRLVIETIGDDLCGMSPVRFVVLTQGRRATTADFEEIRLDIAYFSGDPSSVTECGSDPYFSTRRRHN